MDVMLRRRQIMAMQTGELPGEYRRVDYLQTPGGGTYINSGITMSEDLVFEIDFQLTEVTKSVYFMGEYFGTSFYLWISGTGSSLYFQTAFGAPYRNTTLFADTDRHIFVYSFSNGEAIVKNGDDVIWKSLIGTMSTRSILVAGTPSNGIPVKTYSSKMIKNGVAVQNLIPCVRKSDSKPGMYDLCGSICPLTNSPFYINAGTGEFIVGPDVN